VLHGQSSWPFARLDDHMHACCSLSLECMEHRCLGRKASRRNEYWGRRTRSHRTVNFQGDAGIYYYCSRAAILGAGGGKNGKDFKDFKDGKDGNLIVRTGKVRADPPIDLLILL
jgi:hypothetical protein